MSKFEYADDAALIGADAATATARVTTLAAGSITDATVVISQAKSKVMHVHRKLNALLSQVYVGNTPLENVYSFEYLGAIMLCDGADGADVRHRMAIAQTIFGSLPSIWTDHRLSRA